jgi:cellulose synthase/poly-beta-1,6-N-acetylglucosamine synthase-like glycosyltransferase
LIFACRWSCLARGGCSTAKFHAEWKWAGPYGVAVGYNRARAGAWLGADLKSGSEQAEQGLEAGSINLDDAPSDVLPLFPGHLIAGMLQRLTPQDRELALRHKLVPAAVLPGMTVYSAATIQAQREAAALGLRVVARIDLAAYRKAVRHVLGPGLLRQAVSALARSKPAFSALHRFTPHQLLGTLLCALGLVAAGRFGDWGYVLLAASVVAGLFFAMAVAIRVLALLPAKLPQRGHIAALPAQALPVYTVLVPLFRETAVLNQLIGGLMTLDYPVAKLDIKLILEEEDTLMQRAVLGMALPDHFDVIIVPSGKPQTKPRALNYALQFSRGELLTIYDSEDIPEPDQLRRAASIFAARDDGLACLQAVLTYYNPNENWITRQFTAEYAALFNVMLPALAASGLPLPLGGTSNHFRTRALVDVGAWDPFNVTEDADLGYRFTRMGYETDAFSSKTYEEANTQVWNWMRQRRRWLKGFLHTWLVLMRNPGLLLRDVGLTGFWVIQCMSLGVFASALLHPFFLAHAIWFFASGQFHGQLSMPLHGAVIGLNGAILLLGYGAAIACARKGLLRLGYRRWTGTLISMPLYWMLMTPAAWMALWDFAVRPHHWHKTEHGLSALLRRPAVKGPRHARS